MCDFGAVQQTPRDQDHPCVKVGAVRLVIVEPPPLMSSAVVSNYPLLVGLVKAALSFTKYSEPKGWWRKKLLKGLVSLAQAFDVLVLTSR
jgi:hypothetical protein